ncbi:MAG: DUF2202 domain-containing protein [Candidatus Gracilibacteria bacterium]|nr:DUF2202 domain-containing protein [Candidatus Gracilibacteria bacterium]
MKNFKNLAKTFSVFGIFLIILFGFSACNIRFRNTDNSDEYIVADEDFLKPAELVAASDSAGIGVSDFEIEALYKMREEEKLAFDVYSFLGEKWNLQIFKNIAKSELTHTDSVKYLIDLYGLQDPVKQFKEGIYTSEDFKILYEQLTEKGSSSLLDALIVGATVEDLDIYDLDELLAKVENANVYNVFQNLRRGSTNHLRAFVSQISRNGGEYIPQYISQSEYEEILSQSQSRGPGNGNGRK